MYPDQLDIELNLRSLPGIKPSADKIFADSVLAFHFINLSRKYCYNRKRHEFVPVTEVQRITENFIRHNIDQFALLVALRMLRIDTRLDTKINPGVMSVKLPPLVLFGECRQQWHERMIEVQQEIDEEIRTRKS